MNLNINTFNTRSWLTSSLSAEDKFSFYLDYYHNGNVKTQRLMGSYRLDYSGEQREVNSTYTYDNSNRLIQAGKTNPKVYSPEETFSYDKDGNILTLTRDYSGDNFSYQYYEGTSKLKSIDGGVTQHYAYDYNGNVTEDVTRKITGIKYDSRNLPVEMTIMPKDSKYKYRVKYEYDESGNRVRKMIEQTEITNPGLLPLEWTLFKDEIYVRDVSGKEIAVYENSNLSYYNIWGSGLEGKIKKDEKGNTKYYYYYKDHLGSVRAVLEGSSGKIIQAQDYDAWGDIFRQYNSEDTTVNKFTSKERDKETGYDYFGARYYDSRIGRWLQVEPLLDKYIQYSPYQYGLLNPMILMDVNGKDVYISGSDAINAVKSLNESTNNSFIISIDTKTGKLEYWGEATTAQEKLLVKAINDRNINVNLITTDANYIEGKPFAVGSYYGSEKSNDKIETYQFINLRHAEIWQQAGGSDVGKSVMHEVLESYEGAVLFPGEKGFKEENYEKAHNEIVGLESPKGYYPQIRNEYKEILMNSIKYKIHSKLYLYNEKRDKNYLLFENQEAQEYRK